MTLPINGLNNANLTPMPKLGQAQASDKVNTVPVGQTKTDKSDDMYGGLVKFNNKPPVYEGIASTQNFMDYLIRNNF